MDWEEGCQSPDRKGMGKKVKEKRKKPLGFSMVGVLLLCWLLPLMLIASSMLYFVSAMLGRQIEKAVTSSMDNAVKISEIRLADILAASRNASYMTNIKDSYKAYQKSMSERELHSGVSFFLDQQYKYDVSMSCCMVFFLENPERLFYYTYNNYGDNNRRNSDGRVAFFRNNVQEEVLRMGETLDTDTRLLFFQGHLYMVRNLMDSFKPYAMLVIELNPGDIFDSLDSVWGAEHYQVYVDGMPILEQKLGAEVDLDDDRYDSVMANSVYNDEEGLTYKVIRWEKQELVLAIKVNNTGLLDDLYMLRYVFFLVVVFMIPLAAIVFWFFHAKVSRPVGGLVKASKKIMGGEYGYQNESKVDSREFAYLNRTFNAMSLELKYQFERIYKEELELKDAQILALQSQINPHFLNNTLEIINWEARMNGDDKVSSMIEALGTMLSATMNKEQRRFVTLAEELSYVDAYLHIISRRFGSRFKVYRDIDKSLLHLEVPILIIQPIVENAVEHGVEAHREGMVAIRIYADWDKMVIEIKNNGGMDSKDKEKVDFLLSGGKQDSKAGHVSLGIQNVNRRIRIIYGSECGLTIQSDEENCTVSRIVVKMQHDSNKSQ